MTQYIYIYVAVQIRVTYVNVYLKRKVFFQEHSG